MGTGKLIPAAAYIRMSGRQQDKSPAEQRAEITKLAKREGCNVVEWFDDQAITGDSSVDARPGLAALLKAAKAGKFKLVLAWHTNRVSREDPMDAIGFYNKLRKAGVGLHTCCEGHIDLEDFAKQLLLFVNQKASNDYLLELSAKSLRGRIADAKTGCHNGGRAVFGMDRGLFDPTSKLVRRLQPGERAHLPGHQIRLLPCTDQGKIDAVKYAFKRFDSADLSRRQLARELEAKGFPSPAGWLEPVQCDTFLEEPPPMPARPNGVRRHGVSITRCRAETLFPATAKASAGRRKKHLPDAIALKMPIRASFPWPCSIGCRPSCRSRGTPAQTQSRISVVRADLLRALRAAHVRGRKRDEKQRPTVRVHARTLVQTYCNHNGPSSGCGRNPIDAKRVLSWLTQKLQEVYLGPGRDALVQEIRKQLKAEPKANKRDVTRLEKRAADLDKEVNRLVKAIRTLDADELVEELALVQAERERVKAELAEAGKLTAAVDLDAEAERIADRLWEIGERLGDSDPAILREVLRQFVSKITCRWEATDRQKRLRCRLIGGTVELRPQTPFSSPNSVYGGSGASQWPHTSLIRLLLMSSITNGMRVTSNSTAPLGWPN